ncbi:MAG: flagellar hook-length control protein FliK [Pseudobutyrivibrio sp.]|nr:flagellar hook-length control protein FliK [Pseudobutyrivibrio sp.]
MNINSGLNPYNSNYINGADRTQMSQSQSLTGSVTDSLKEGEVFEGSVNSIDNGKVTIGLANGQTMTARLDSGVTLTPGQSVFFEVKSNDGNLVQIRPVSLNSLEANPTLLKALDMANISATERTINMVNSMMQNSMSINPENIATMNRAMLNNPGVDPQTLVTMAKYGMELSPESVHMFENYAADKAVLTDNFDVISDMLPQLMTDKSVTTADVINITNTLREIFIPSEEAVVTEAGQPNEAIVNGDTATSSTNTGETAVINNPGEVTITGDLPKGEQVMAQADAEAVVVQEEASNTSAQIPSDTVSDSSNDSTKQAIIAEKELGNQVLNTFASDKQISSFNTILNNLPDFPKNNAQVFSENGSLKSDADINQLFKEISEYLKDNPDLPKETLNDLLRSSVFKGSLKNMILNSFAMEPKDVTKPGEVSKLYERVLKQTEALERLISNFSNKAAETIKGQTTEIKQNINFMNSANEMYNFVQIPLKMYNQNTDGMLYVRQNKHSSYEAGEEVTAFLHFDMEYLGPTDVFISLKESKVGCKWNLADEDSMNLIEQNLDLLTDRLAKKGFTIKSEVTCGNPKASFVEDFLGVPPVATETSSEGLVHRYSFDMRA